MGEWITDGKIYSVLPGQAILFGLFTNNLVKNALKYANRNVKLPVLHNTSECKSEKMCLYQRDNNFC